MQVEELPIGSIKPYEKNPRNNDAAVNGVAESIKQFGFQQPIVIDSAGVIIAGHTRYKAAKKLGLTTVPCVRAENLTKSQVKAYRVLDNKLNELSAWDFSLLEEEISAIKFEFSEFNFEDVKFESPEFPSVNAIDESSAVPARSALGSAPASAYVSSASVENSASVQPFATISAVDTEIQGTLPQELQGVELKPNPLPRITGDDATLLNRVIIVFSEEQRVELCTILGLDNINKVVYKFDELRLP